MKVLLIEPNIDIDGSGGGMHLRELADHLSKYVELTVVCKCRDTSLFKYKVVNTNAERLSILDFLKIYRLAKQADVVHSRTDPWELAGPISSKLLRKPLVSELNTNFMSYEKRGVFRDILYPLIQLGKLFWLKQIVNLADVITCVSDSIKRSMIRNGLHKDKLIVNRNGGNPYRFPKEGKESLRKKLGLPLKKMLVLYMTGELSPRYRFEDLPEIDATYLIIGGITKNPDYAIKVKKLLGKRAIFVNKVSYDKTAEYIKASDIAIALYGESSNLEPFGYCPLKILDCMAGGLPVIASDRAWIREILTKKEGIITNDFSFAIEKLKDPKLRTELGNAARARLEQELTWDHTAKRLIEIYAKVAEQKT